MNHLGLFAKYWEPGKVKTRLAATHGTSTACQLYHAFLFHLLDTLQDTADLRTVVFSPADRHQDFLDSIDDDWNLVPQVESDLGTRMWSFFKQQQSTSDKVVIIGADSPNLDPLQIDAAFEALDSVDVVIGPCTDGGYYLIGMRGCWNVFTGITYSVDSVLSETRAKMESLGLSHQLLPVKTDVDDAEALSHFRNVLNSTDRSNRPLKMLEEKIDSILNSSRSNSES